MALVGDPPPPTPNFPKLLSRYFEREAAARAASATASELDVIYVGGAFVRNLDPELRRLRKVERRAMRLPAGVLEEQP